MLDRVEEDAPRGVNVQASPCPEVAPPAAQLAAPDGVDADLAIADASDQILDSVVLIEEGSFSSTTTDWGDLPAGYGTRQADDGAVHAIRQGFFLGATVDAELDGRPTVDAQGDDPLLDLARLESIARVRHTIATLPAHYREVIVLCDLEDLDYARAAEILDQPIGTVRSRLHRARQLLMRKLNSQLNAAATCDSGAVYRSTD